MHSFDHTTDWICVSFGCLAKVRATIRYKKRDSILSTCTGFLTAATTYWHCRERQVCVGRCWYKYHRLDSDVLEILPFDVRGGHYDNICTKPPQNHKDSQCSPTTTTTNSKNDNYPRCILIETTPEVDN